VGDGVSAIRRRDGVGGSSASSAAIK